MVQLRTLGGAVARVPVGDQPCAHRDRRIMVNVVSMHEGDEGRPTSESWVEGTAEALHGDELDAYCNFVGDEGPERRRARYSGPTWDRLRDVKGRCDPDNRFRLDQNIPPA